MNFGKKALREKLDTGLLEDTRQKNRFKMFLISALTAVFLGIVTILVCMGAGAFKKFSVHCQSGYDQAHRHKKYHLCLGRLHHAGAHPVRLQPRDRDIR